MVQAQPNPERDKLLKSSPLEQLAVELPKQTAKHALLFAPPAFSNHFCGFYFRLGHEAGLGYVVIISNQAMYWIRPIHRTTHTLQSFPAMRSRHAPRRMKALVALALGGETARPGRP